MLFELNSNSHSLKGPNDEQSQIRINYMMKNRRYDNLGNEDFL